MQSIRLSVPHTICLHFCFLVSRSGMWGIYFPSISFCLYVVALSAYCASNVWVDVCYSSYLVTQLESAEVSLNGDQQLWSWTISVTEGIQDPESWTHYSSLVTALFSPFTHKLQCTWRGDYCECVRPAQLPVLTWSSSSVPPGDTTSCPTRLDS